jgi:hypothetical protein
VDYINLRLVNDAMQGPVTVPGIPVPLITTKKSGAVIVLPPWRLCVKFPAVTNSVGS